MGPERIQTPRNHNSLLRTFESPAADTLAPPTLPNRLCGVGVGQLHGCVYGAETTKKKYAAHLYSVWSTSTLSRIQGACMGGQVTGFCAQDPKASWASFMGKPTQRFTAQRATTSCKQAYTPHHHARTRCDRQHKHSDSKEPLTLPPNTPCQAGELAACFQRLGKILRV